MSLIFEPGKSASLNLVKTLDSLACNKVPVLSYKKFLSASSKTLSGLLETLVGIKSFSDPPPS